MKSNKKFINEKKTLEKFFRAAGLYHIRFLNAKLFQLQSVHFMLHFTWYANENDKNCNEQQMQHFCGMALHCLQHSAFCTLIELFVCVFMENVEIVIVEQFSGTHH